MCKILLKLAVGIFLCYSSAAQSYASLNEAFMQHFEAGRYQEALPIALKLVAMAEIEFGKKEINYAITNENVATTYYRLEEWKAALPYYHEALETYISAAGTDEIVEVGRCYNAIGSCHLAIGVYDSARTYFIESYNYFLKYPADQYDNLIVVAENLINASFFSEQYRDIEIIVETLLPVIEAKEGSESERIFSFLNHAGNAFRNELKWQEAQDYYGKSLLLAKKLYGENHITYASILELQADCYRNTGQFSNCNRLLQEAGNIYRNNSDADYYIQANYQHNIANLLSDLAKFEVSFLHFDTAIALIKTGGLENDVLYLTIVKSKAYTYMDADKSQEANQLLHIVESLYKNHFGAEHIFNAEILLSLANTEFFLNQFAAAEQHLASARDILNKNNQQKSYLYARIYELEGMIEHGKGNSARGIELCKEAEVLSTEIFGDSSSFTASALSNQGIIYQEIGDYVQAEEVLRRSFMIRNKLFGWQHPQTAYSMANLAMVLVMQSRFDDADILLEASLIAMINNGMLASPNTQSILSNIAIHSKRQGDYDAAEKLFQKVLENLDENAKSDSKVYATVLANLSTIYLEKKDFLKGLEYATKTLNYAERLFGRKSLLYMKAANNTLVAYSNLKQFDQGRALGKSLLPLIQSNLGDSSELLGMTYNNLSSLELRAGDLEMATKYLQQSLDIQIHYYKENLFALSERDQVAWWQRNSSNFQMLPALLIVKGDPDEALLSRMANQQLQLKGFVLSNASAVLKKIRSIEDPALQDIIDQWQFTRILYRKQSSLPVQERSYQIDSLRIMANKLEQAVYIEAGNHFKLNQNSIAWQDVQKALKPGEVAVEFIRAPVISQLYYSDTVQYAAIVIARDQPVRLVPLGYEEDIQWCLSGGKGDNRETMVNQLYRTQIGTIKKTTFTGDSLYQLIWAPLEPFLENASIVNIAPDGLLHKVAFAALPVGKDSVLLDHVEIRQFSSLRQIPDARAELQKIEHLVVVGNANFNGDGKNIIREYWSQLPGTQNEMNAIQRFFESKRKTVTKWEINEANEQNLKGLANPSPDVIHIATHGFFLPDVEKSADIQSNNSDGSFLAAFDDPLLRSGIILASANKFWRGDQQVKDQEDGILTAYEIAQLDWQHTKLVVLSACETGLGDLKGAEGVFGLQRALKLAGAQNMIVSLWQVPDAETAELMILFYEQVLSGKTIRDAFFYAQKAMRAKHKPFAWAAFVLVE